MSSIINAVVRRERQHIAVLEERIRAARRLRRAFIELRNAELVLRQVREAAEKSLDPLDVDTLLTIWRRPPVERSLHYSGEWASASSVSSNR